MRKTITAAALTVAITLAAAPLSAAPRSDSADPRVRQANPNPIVRAVDHVAKKLRNVIRAFEIPTVPHP